VRLRRAVFGYLAAVQLALAAPNQTIRAVGRAAQEKSRPGMTPNGFLMRLPARRCSGSVASVGKAGASWLTQS
jgi:hypothetical protein